MYIRERVQSSMISAGHADTGATSPLRESHNDF